MNIARCSGLLMMFSTIAIETIQIKIDWNSSVFKTVFKPLQFFYILDPSSKLTFKTISKTKLQKQILEHVLRIKCWSWTFFLRLIAFWSVRKSNQLPVINFVFIQDFLWFCMASIALTCLIFQLFGFYASKWFLPEIFLVSSNFIVLL